MAKPCYASFYNRVLLVVVSFLNAMFSIADRLPERMKVWLDEHG